jgi:hypothetical protein
VPTARRPRGTPVLPRGFHEGRLTEIDGGVTTYFYRHYRGQGRSLRNSEPNHAGMTG